MPSNHILINDAIKYFVYDDVMDELIQWLRENGQEAEMRVGKPSQANYKTKRSPEPSYNR